MEKLIVLDYEDGSVHVYDVQPGTVIDDEYIDNLGFHLSGCYYMHDTGISIHFHKRVLQ